MKYEITPEYDKRARSVYLKFLHIPSLSLDHLCFFSLVRLAKEDKAYVHTLLFTYTLLCSIEISQVIYLIFQTS